MNYGWWKLEYLNVFHACTYTKHTKKYHYLKGMWLYITNFRLFSLLLPKTHIHTEEKWLVMTMSRPSWNLLVFSWNFTYCKKTKQKKQRETAPDSQIMLPEQYHMGGRL